PSMTAARESKPRRRWRREPARRSECRPGREPEPRGEPEAGRECALDARVESAVEARMESLMRDASTTLGIKLTGDCQHPNQSQGPGADQQESSKHDETSSGA